ncbi:hypothetical protein [Pantoea wallisii]|uniref:hypothetical protein n=1 Tax=Pantoea wallisii TaxID=1076551 RepID=UPI000FFB39D4|nr:hypothetical protein [Pantoea wallisii]
MDRAFNNHILTGLTQISPPYRGYFFDPEHITTFFAAKTANETGRCLNYSALNDKKIPHKIKMECISLFRKRIKFKGLNGGENQPLTGIKKALAGNYRAKAYLSLF